MGVEIPDYRRREADSPMPGVRSNLSLPESAAGGGPAVARSFDAAGDLSETASRLMYQTDLTRAKLSGADAVKAFTQIRYNLEAQKGTNSFGASDAAEKALEDSLGQIEGSLANDRQKKMFRETADELRKDLRLARNVHVARQSRVVQTQALDASLENFQLEAISNDLDPNAVGKGIARQMRVIDQMGSLEGWPKAEIDRVKFKAQTQTHAAKYKDLQQRGLWHEADQYLVKASPLMDPRVVQALPGTTDGNMPFRQAFKLISETNGKALPREDTLRRLSPVQVESLVDTQKLKLSGQVPLTLPEKFQDLTDLVASSATNHESRRDFVALDLDTYYPWLSPGDLAGFKKMQENLKKGAKDPELDNVRMNAALVNQTLADIGIQKPKDKRAVLLKQKLWDGLLKLQHEKGEKATDVEIKQELARLTKEEVVKGGGFLGLFDKKKRAFQLKPGEVIEGESQGVTGAPPPPGMAPKVRSAGGPSDEQRRVIKAQLAARGKLVTEANILHVWQANQGGR